ncbi:MAG: hypothetical protein ACD_49C00049G0011 [uncultured bacterium (gcode 4)]|uniref:DUF2958 domain-containing protein n=1 Tax=uncultured bacterium (gcode 4) TaxID=1234023 RepID=K2BC39_9BACT|nr:MAG: hypothetical protein ACD_49C00049G0011 [uncultured bacterium (gcode 4)]
MKLLTKDIIKLFKKYWNQSNSSDPVVICKFFNPTWAWSWYVTEYIEEDRLFYGYVSIFWDHCDEWGYFLLDELEIFRWRFGLKIERDISFEPIRFSLLGLNKD